MTILEKGSGDPIEGATVVLEQSGDYDVTNQKGIVVFEDFAFEDIIKNIKILHAGYETLQQSLVKNTLDVTLYLYPLTVDGAALEVIEDRIKEKISKISLVEAELRNVPGTAGDPLKVLSTLPGVVAASGQGGQGSLYIRGSGSDDNGVLINRIPVNYLYHFGDLSGIAPSTVNPSLVKDFNAFLGGFPVEYPDKLGGILDVQLRNPRNDRLHQTYRVAIHEAAFLIEGPIQEKDDNDSFYVSGRMSYLDRVLTPDIINKFINDNADEDEQDDFTIVTLPKYYDAQANWHRELKKGALDVYYFTAGDRIAINLDGTQDTDPDIVGDLSVDLNYHSVGVNWSHRFNRQFSQISTLTFQRTNTNQQIGTDPKTGESFFVDTKNTAIKFDPQLNWRVNNKNEIISGINFNRIWAPIDLFISVLPTEDNPDYNFTRAEKYRVNTTLQAGSINPYIKHRWAITDKLTSTLGLRFSYTKASGDIEMSAVSPRVALEYQINQRLLLNASWGKYVQFPEGATIVPGLGNPSMVYTEAEHRIIGFEYRPTPRWTLKMETYQKPMEKLVLFIPNKSPPENYDNLGEGNAYGFDVLIKREFSNRTMGWLSYSFARSSRTTVLGRDREFTGDQPHTLNMVWSQPIGPNWKHWTWGFKMTVHSGATHTPVIGRIGVCENGADFTSCADQPNSEDDPDFSHWEPVKGKQNSERLPVYFQMSVRVDREFRFNTWRMNIFMDVQNLSFRKNIVDYNYGKKYNKINNREAVAAFFFPLPLFGVEVEF